MLALNIDKIQLLKPLRSKVLVVIIKLQGNRSIIVKHFHNVIRMLDSGQFVYGFIIMTKIFYNGPYEAQIAFDR